MVMMVPSHARSLHNPTKQDFINVRTRVERQAKEP